MIRADNQAKFLNLRQTYSFFAYESINYEIKSSLKVEYLFNCSDKHYYKPSFELTFNKLEEIKINFSEIENLLFHIGMVELVSYWKATCSPQIIIKPFALSQQQCDWWRKIYFNGLGEFFYLNGIETTINDFVRLESVSSKILTKQLFDLNEATIVPIGGGKDSAVTIDILKDAGVEVRPFIVNTRAACSETIFNAGISQDKVVHVNRKLDPTLLEHNKNGYLNGHTPFSALLAFMASLSAIMTGCKHIALSNESSASEPTVKNTEINHQYSKSFDFEQDFRNYLNEYITGSLNYFSFLRPISELQIARLFAQRKQFYAVFKSCNAGSKTNTWCGSCPKCLFTFIILSPFIEMNELVKIFGKNLLDDPMLDNYLCELIGISEVKPFECVGTTDEVLVCLKYLQEKTVGKLPFLLEKNINHPVFKQVEMTDFYRILNEYQEKNFLTPAFNTILKNAISN